MVAFRIFADYTQLHTYHIFYIQLHTIYMLGIFRQHLLIQRMKEGRIQVLMVELIWQIQIKSQMCMILVQLLLLKILKPPCLVLHLFLLSIS